MADVRLEWNDELQQFVVFQLPGRREEYKNVFVPKEIILEAKNSSEKNGKLTITVDEEDLKRYVEDFGQTERLTPPAVSALRALAKTAPVKKALELMAKYETYRTSEGAFGTLPERPEAPSKEPTGIQKLFTPSKEIPLSEAAEQVGVELPKTTAEAVPPVFEYGQGSVADVGPRAGRGVPLRQVTSPLTVPYGSLTPSEETNELGLFESNGQLSLLLPDATGRSSSLVSLNQFTVDLLNLPPDKVIEYQKAFGLKQTGRMDTALQGKILDRAKTASLENYNRANPLVQDNTQISWEDAVINPQFGGGAAGGGGVSVTAKQLQAAKDAIQISATQLGVALDDKALNSLASAYARGDVNATVLPYEIVRQGTIDYTKGAAAETVANLRKTASAYGVEYNEDWYKTSVANILSGKAAQDTYDAQIKEIAKSRYPSLAEQIDAGYTVQSIASPYINAMSQILEINPETISINDPMIQQSLVYIGPDGKPSQKPIWQMEQDARKDERWRYTKNAERELMGTGINLLRKYGLVV